MIRRTLDKIANNIPMDFENFMQEQEPLPDMELVHILEGMSPPARIEYKRQLLAQISDREMLCRMIDDVNAAEGIEVTIIN